MCLQLFIICMTLCNPKKTECKTSCDLQITSLDVSNKHFDHNQTLINCKRHSINTFLNYGHDLWILKLSKVEFEFRKLKLTMHFRFCFPGRFKNRHLLNIYIGLVRWKNQLRHSNWPFRVPCCGRPPGRLRSKINLNLLIWFLFPFVGIKLFEPPGGDRIFLSDFVPVRIIQFGHFQMISIDGIKNKFIVGNLYDFVWFLVTI